MSLPIGFLRMGPVFLHLRVVNLTRCDNVKAPRTIARTWNSAEKAFCNGARPFCNAVNAFCSGARPFCSRATPNAIVRDRFTRLQEGFAMVRGEIAQKPQIFAALRAIKSGWGRYIWCKKNAVCFAMLITRWLLPPPTNCTDNRRGSFRFVFNSIASLCRKVAAGRDGFVVSNY